MTITFGSQTFVDTMKGAVVIAYPPGEQSAAWLSRSVDDYAHFARVPQEILSPADAAKTYWRWDVMPKTMQRLA